MLVYFLSYYQPESSNNRPLSCNFLIIENLNIYKKILNLIHGLSSLFFVVQPLKDSQSGSFLFEGFRNLERANQFAFTFNIFLSLLTFFLGSISDRKCKDVWKEICPCWLNCVKNCINKLNIFLPNSGPYYKIQCSQYKEYGIFFWKG